eukprot:6269185-Prymnesium_polylepis.1
MAIGRASGWRDAAHVFARSTRIASSSTLPFHWCVHAMLWPRPPSPMPLGVIHCISAWVSG